MSKQILNIEKIIAMVKPLAQKYHVKEVYLFGSYVRGEADENSDLDFLVFGGEGFKLTQIFAFGEELREILQKRVMQEAEWVILPQAAETVCAKILNDRR